MRVNCNNVTCMNLYFPSIAYICKLGSTTALPHNTEMYTFILLVFHLIIMITYSPCYAVPMIWFFYSVKTRKINFRACKKNAMLCVVWLWNSLSVVIEYTLYTPHPSSWCIYRDTDEIEITTVSFNIMRFRNMLQQSQWDK